MVDGEAYSIPAVMAEIRSGSGPLYTVSGVRMRRCGYQMRLIELKGFGRERMSKSGFD
jgi:hypothetical protein